MQRVLRILREYEKRGRVTAWLRLLFHSAFSASRTNGDAGLANPDPELNKKKI